eukprot:9247051-Lingulodinium_polyedra.AAC.1
MCRVRQHPGAALHQPGQEQQDGYHGDSHEDGQESPPESVPGDGVPCIGQGGSHLFLSAACPASCG